MIISKKKINELSKKLNRASMIRKNKLEKKIPDNTVENDLNISKIKKIEEKTLYMITDHLFTELDKRVSIYDYVCNIFWFIAKLNLELLSETSADIFINIFKDDIDETNIKQDIVHFSSYIWK